MPDPRDYLASSLANGEEDEELKRISELVHPPEYGNVPVRLPGESLGPVPEQPKGFMDAQPFTAARQHIADLSPEQRQAAGLGGMAYGAGRAAVEEMDLDIGNPLAMAETAIFGERPEATNVPPTAPTLRTSVPSGTEDQTIVPSTIGYRDGVFTNVNVTDEDRAAYRGGVSDFRENMRTQQDALGPPPKGTVTTPGGHMLGDPDAPLPGDDNYPEGGFVSYPGGEIEDPTKALTEEGWRAMAPGAKRSYMEQVGEISGTRQVAAAGEGAEHDARMANDPAYAVKIRFGPYFQFYEMGENRPENQLLIQQTLNEAMKLDPSIREGTPEYEARKQLITQTIVKDWLKAEHASVAPWDEVFAKALGVEF